MADVTAEYDIVGGNAPDKFTIIAGDLRETVAENVNLSDALVFVAAGNAVTTIAEQTGSTPERVAGEVVEAFLYLRHLLDNEYFVKDFPRTASGIEALFSRIQRDKTDG